MGVVHGVTNSRNSDIRDLSQIRDIRELITDHRNNYNNEQVWNIMGIIKCGIETPSVLPWNAVVKVVPTNLYDIGLPQTLNL